MSRNYEHFRIAPSQSHIDSSPINWESRNLCIRIVDFVRTRLMEFLMEKLREKSALKKMQKHLQNGVLARSERPFTLESIPLNLSWPELICVYAPEWFRSSDWKGTQYKSSDFENSKEGFQKLLEWTLKNQRWRIAFILESPLEQDRLVSMVINSTKTQVSDRKIRGIIVSHNSTEDGVLKAKSLAKIFGLPVFNDQLGLISN